ncbi:MAG TPA: allantoicase, partial [Hellea balneolensis]|nr:allantoicase [Hellea balneolensis]
IDGKYDDNGKWMDGWESRRKRVAGHDFAVIKLGRSGRIRGLDIDTSHFTGNFPPFAMVEAVRCPDGNFEEANWVEIVPKRGLDGNSHHYVTIENEQIFTHVRLHIYPDGGVARLRIYGHIFTDWENFDRTQTLDLAALEMGGRALYANDTHFGVPENLIAPGKGINMGDGWETRRRREPGNDWAVLALAHEGVVERIVLDTAYFKGNYPDRASIQAVRMDGDDADIVAGSKDWPVLLDEQKLSMDKEHVFVDELVDVGPITHIRLNIFPDGGVSRLRLFGKITG